MVAHQLSAARPSPQWASACSAWGSPPLRWLVQRHTSRACHSVGLSSCTLLLNAPLRVELAKPTDTSVKNWKIELFLFLCLFGFNVVFKHLRSYQDGACSGTLTNVLPHRNAMPQTQDMTPHPVTVYRHGADLSLCYPLMCNVTMEYTATHVNVLGETRPGNPSPTFHTHQRMLNLMLWWWLTVGSSVESTVPTGSWTRDLWCENPLRYPLAHSDFLLFTKWVKSKWGKRI